MSQSTEDNKVKTIRPGIQIKTEEDSKVPEPNENLLEQLREVLSFAEQGILQSISIATVTYDGHGSHGFVVTDELENTLIAETTKLQGKLVMFSNALDMQMLDDYDDY